MDISGSLETGADWPSLPLLEDAIVEQMPHVCEPMQCVNCGHEWVQVYPAHIERPTKCHKCGKNATIGKPYCGGTASTSDVVKPKGKG